MEKRTWVKIAALMLIVVMALGVTACGSKTEEQEPMSTGPELSEKQMDDLYQQAADKTKDIRTGRTSSRVKKLLMS